MKNLYPYIVIVGILFYIDARCQTTDKIIDVGTHKLNFTLKPGKGIPIVFESGAGNDGRVWEKIVALLSQKTDAPLITYDRAGFGKSEIDTANINIVNEVRDLERGLKQLGFFDRYFLVAHSLGGNYAMKFISNDPKKVIGAVFIDIVSPYFMTEKRARETREIFMDSLDVIKKESIGFYHLILNYENTSRVMRNVSDSIEIPVTVIASGKTPFEGNDRELFINGLKRFAKEKKNRKYILIENADHYVFYDEPELVVDEIVNLYHLSK